METESQPLPEEYLPPHILLAARNDFSYFCKYVTKQPFGKVHEKIAKQILEGKKNTMVEMARGHFKTWMFSKNFPLWLMWRQSEKPLMIGLETSNMPQTQYILSELIASEIEHNPILAERLLPETWSARHLKTKNGHQVIAQPFGRKGFHYDWLISDDLQQESESGSGLSISAIKRTFWSSSWPMTQTRRGHHVVIGTPISLDDFYSDFENKPAWNVMKFPVVITDENKKWLAPQFPEHPAFANLELIQELKDNTPIWSFMSEYMLDPIGDGTVVFSSDLIDYCMKIAYPSITPGDESASQYYAGWDVALSDKDAADFSAITIVRRTPGIPLRVVAKWRGKAGEEEQFEIMREFHKNFAISKLVIEQKGLSYAMAEKASKDYTLAHSIEKFDTTHASKNRLIGDLRLVMQNKMLGLDGDQDISRELRSFGLVSKDGVQTFRALSGHDDLVMSLAMAVHAAGGYLPKKRPAAQFYMV